jgi:hypothetical protein
MKDDVGTSGPDAATSPLRSNGTRASAEAVISPELALVDPELAARGQAALPETRDTVESLLQSARARGAGPAAGAGPGRARRIRRRLLGGSLLAVGLAGVVIAVLVFDFGIEFGERSASAEPAIGPIPAAPGEAVATPPRAPRTQKPAPPTPSGSSKQRTHRSSVRARIGAGKDGRARKRAISAPSLARRFAWAPVPRAAGYHVEFFRGSTRVFAASTRRAEIALPRRWRFRGRSQSLEPGDYRWYVWPVFRETGRAPAASVQARLRVG